MTPAITRLRTGLRLARTRFQRFSAAPERMRRRRRARLIADAEPGGPEAALAPADLACDGFSLGALDPDLVRGMLDDWRSLDSRDATTASSQARTTGKAFFREMLSNDDLVRCPSFLATAIDPAVLRSVMRGMGLLPHLESVDILCSVPGPGELSASQLWHYDVNDDRIIKLFVYLEDCGPQNGPFTFIAAGPSQRVSAAVGHYVPDERITQHVPRSQWRTVEGAAGTPFFIDTGRCYHFGSRCTQRRVAYVATYSSGLKFMPRARLWPSLLKREGLDPLQLAVCGIGS